MTDFKPCVIPGTLFVKKADGQHRVAFCADRYELYADEDEFRPCDEHAVARMLYAYRFIDESDLVQLVLNEQEIFQGVFPATMVCAIVLGLAEEPKSVEDIGSVILDEAGTKKLEELRAHFHRPTCPQSYIEEYKAAERERHLRTANRMWTKEQTEDN